MSDHRVAGTVTALWRYPVKSMQGGVVDVVTIDARGVVGDRSWAVRDHVRGGIRGAKKIGPLMGLAARYADGAEPSADKRSPALVLTLPDGREVGSGDADVDARLSAALEHPVSLQALHSPDDLDHFRRGGPDSEDLDRELRDIFGRTDEEPLPDLTPFGHVMEFESPPGTYVDAYPIHLVTTSTVRALVQAAGEAPDVDVRRLRPNVVVDLGDDVTGTPETEWVGATVRVGAVELEIVAPTARCVMVTRPFADLPGNRELLRTIVARFDQCVGVYANVRTPGTVRTGDPVEVLPPEG